MTMMKQVALALALATGSAAVTTQVAEACGGYVISEEDRVQWALAAFLGKLGERVSYGAVVMSDAATKAPKAQLTIEMDTAAGGKRRAKARQTFFLEKRDGEWAVVDWSFPVAAPAAKVAKR